MSTYIVTETREMGGMIAQHKKRIDDNVNTLIEHIKWNYDFDDISYIISELQDHMNSEKCKEEG